MAGWRDDAQLAGGRDQTVEPAVAVEQRAPKRVDQLALVQIEDGERRRLAALPPDRVVQLLESAAGARRQHQLRPLRGAGQGHGRAKPRDAPVTRITRPVSGKLRRPRA